MVKKAGRMILITVHMTEQYVKALDKLVELKLYPSRSEAIRAAIRDLIDKYSLIQRNKKDSLGLIIGL